MIADLAMQRALDRYREVGTSGLTESEKTLVTIWYFESKVANGGFEHFYKSQPGELALFAPTAFRNIGADALAIIAERANAVFGSPVPGDRAARVRALAALPEAVRQQFEGLERDYGEFGTDIDERVEVYLTQKQHPAG